MIMIKRILRWIPAFSVMVIIFLLSQQSGTESKQLSIDFADGLFGNLKESFFGENYIAAVRKAAHFGIYLVLGMCVMWAMFDKAAKIKKIYTISVMICVFYAISDELHQLFVPERAAMALDVCIDSLGAFLGCSLVLLMYKVFRK